MVLGAHGSYQVEVKAAEAAGHAAASNAKGHGPVTWLVVHLAAPQKKIKTSC